MGAAPALAKLVPGVNDLATLYPEVAKEADGWEPSEVAGKSHKKLQWRCENGHTWSAVVDNRSRLGRNCPVCAGKKVLPGYNDFATKFPALAIEAYGWDPSTVTPGSNKKLQWRCVVGHTWPASVNNRSKGTGCPYCSGLLADPGVNDLATLYPELAKEADGWDPSTVSAGSARKHRWQCSKGHRWESTVNDRTPPKGQGCPVCAGQKIIVGINDLATFYPDIAAEAKGWDPITVSSKSGKKLFWQCKRGHIFSATVYSRTLQETGCPVCSGQRVLSGFNDLATIYPEVAREAMGWDPSTVTAKSNAQHWWLCEKGHTWEASVANRTNRHSGCPVCAVTGFNPDKLAWFYFLERPGEQQLGITNYRENRLRFHAKFGWQELEVVGPFPGDQVLALEKKLKLWLRKEVGLVPGTHENWFTASLEVRSLAELKARSGVETDLF